MKIIQTITIPEQVVQVGGLAISLDGNAVKYLLVRERTDEMKTRSIHVNGRCVSPACKNIGEEGLDTEWKIVTYFARVKGKWAVWRNRERLSPEFEQYMIQS